MPLQSKLFSVPHDQKLEACLISDPAHITPGAQGEHVKKIQIALNQLSNGKIFLIIDGKYGPKTAAAVVKFKEAQSPPLRRPGQSVADNIVGSGTIKALDQQMRDLENAPEIMTGFISLTPFGTPHNHNLCVPFLDSDDFKGRISHHGTPINPQRFGRMAAIGGTNEVKYLGFENFMPDPAQDPDLIPSMVKGRPFTSSIRDRSCSDICFRSAPIDKFMKAELKRIAAPGCRLTYANNIGTVASEMTFLLSLGQQIQFAVVNKDPSADPFDLNSGLHVVVISMQNLR